MKRIGASRGTGSKAVTSWYFVGVDLGQTRDFTAITVVERAEFQGAWDAVAYAWRKEVELRVRFVERVALGTPYPEVVRRVTQVVQSRELAGRCHLVVDATGVGKPVIDMLRDARPGCEILAATITGGDTETTSGGYYRVPKQELIVGLQTLLQMGALQIAGNLPLWEVLEGELMEMQVRLSPSGSEKYGVWREGRHDDLVLALSLACWGAKKVRGWLGRSGIGKGSLWRSG